MSPVLRRFLYLDAEVVDEFVSQIEGGLYGEEAQRIVTGGGRNLGGEAGVGVGPASVSSFNKAVALVGEFAPLFGLLEAMGEAPVEDAETAEAMRGLGALSGVFGKNMPLIVRAGGSPRFKFVGQINQDNLRVDLAELEGEATMLAKLQRKLRPKEKYTPLESIPAMAALPREERRQLERGLKNEKDLPDMVISAPAAVVTPIAVYR